MPTYLPACLPTLPTPSPPDQLPADPPTSGSEELVYPRPHLLPPSSHTCRVPRGTLWPECLCMQGKESACRPSIFGVQKFPPNIISRPDLHRPRNRVGGLFGVAPHPLCFSLSFVAEDTIRCRHIPKVPRLELGTGTSVCQNGVIAPSLLRTSRARLR